LRLSVLALVVLLVGCSARPASAWQPEHAEAVAWWVEDVAHGLPRLPAEVDMVGGGPGEAAIARWAAGSDHGGRWLPPRQLAARRSRWPALAAALADGLVLSVGDAGLLAPAPGVPPVRRTEIDGLCDSENADRRLLDGLVLVLGSPDPAVERTYRAAAGSARHKLDVSPAQATASGQSTR
jgi:hypothetical protein